MDQQHASFVIHHCRVLSNWFTLLKINWVPVRVKKPLPALLHFTMFYSAHSMKLLSSFLGPSTTTETETVAKYEIMDGAPVKGESIPIRLFLAGNTIALLLTS